MSHLHIVKLTSFSAPDEVGEENYYEVSDNVLKIISDTTQDLSAEDISNFLDADNAPLKMTLPLSDQQKIAIVRTNCKQVVFCAEIKENLY